MKAVTDRKELVDVALGTALPDLVIQGGMLVNVLTREVYPADILIKGERIAAVREKDYVVPDGVPVMDAGGKYLAPGLIDPHIHIESSAVSVTEFAKFIVPRGVTSVLEDPHEIANVLGAAGIELFLDEAKNLPLNVFLRVPGSVPGMPAELESSGGRLTFEQTMQLLDREESICLAGDINPGLLLTKNAAQFNKLDYAIHIRKTISGQSPGLSDGALNAFVAAGPEDSHVSRDMDEVLDVIRHGMKALITHRPEMFGLKDYPDLAQVIREKQIDTRMICFCSDDVQPHVLMERGHLDDRVRSAVAAGVDPVAAIQMATINTAELMRIQRDYGSLCPGKIADIILFDDLESLKAGQVIYHGRLAAENGRLVSQPPAFKYPAFALDTMRVKARVAPEDLMLRVRPGAEQARVRSVLLGSLKQEVQRTLPVEDGVVLPDVEQDVLAFAVLDRHNRSGNIGKAFISGFGMKDGAIASTVSHDAHNAFVIGSNFEDMAAAANHLIEMGGGHVAVRAGQVIAQVELPLAGLMAEDPIEVVAEKFRNFERIMVDELQCALDHPLYHIVFVCLPNIPHRGITDKGLIDSDTMTVIDPILEA